MTDKTEEATPRRLRRAREEGDSGASAFAAQSIAFLAAVALAPAAMVSVATRAREDLISTLEDQSPASVRALSVDAWAIGAEVLVLVAPLLAAVAVVSAVATLVQTGGAFSPRRLAPRLSRLNPLGGIRALLSAARLFSVVRALVAAAAVSFLAYGAIAAHLVDLARLSGRLGYVAAAIGELAKGIARDAALVGLALAVIDVVVVRRGWMKRLRMSRHEVKRERKESEGDPEIKAARNRAYEDMLAEATIAGVKNASVVVASPTRHACALRYDESAGDAAPVVIATGEGDLAIRIARAAEDYVVPVVHDAPLARALAKLEVGDAIPEALYDAVAEILRDVERAR